MCHQGERLDLGLRDQHAVEGIAVMHRQRTRSEGM